MEDGQLRIQNKGPKNTDHKAPLGTEIFITDLMHNPMKVLTVVFSFFSFYFIVPPYSKQIVYNLLHKTNRCNFQGFFLLPLDEKFIMRTKKAVKWLIFLNLMFICKQHDSLYIQSVDYFSWAVDRVEWFKLPCTGWTSALTSAFFVFCSGGTHVGQKSADYGLWADRGFQSAAHARHQGTCGGSVSHGRLPVGNLNLI